MLTACTNEVLGPEQKGLAAIGFEGSVAVTLAPYTRADGDDSDFRGKGMMNTAMLQQTGFGVYCWYTGTDDFTTPLPVTARTGSTQPYEMLMRNQKVEYIATQSTPHWTYAPTKYWPLEPDEKLTLRAYAPYVSYDLLTTPTDGTASDRGTPYLPVVVKADDYCNNSQHDPLWGTSNYVAGIHDTDDDNKYGTPYDNFTYTMSGSELTADSRDGTIDWYFHHGMAAFALQASLLDVQPDTKVRITGIHSGPFYNQGLLDICSSPTASSSEKPIWRDRRHPDEDDFYVDIMYNHTTTVPAHNDLTNVVLTRVAQNVALYPLLAIPRDYSGTNERMEVTVTYTVQEGDSEPSVHSATAYVDLNVQGNTVYWLQLSLNAEDNKLYIAAFINIDWQVGSYEEVSVGE